MVKMLGVVMVLFLVVAVLAIALAMQPVTLHIGDQAVAPSALTDSGLLLRADAWKEYPQYNFGLGIIAIISFAGASIVNIMIANKTTPADGTLEASK